MSIGFWQLILILIIVLLVFGAGKLPRVMGDLGKGIKSLKEGIKEGKEEESGDGDTPDTPAKAEEKAKKDTPPKDDDSATKDKE